VAQPSYITLGERLIHGIDRLFKNVIRSPPLRWSSGVLRRVGLTGHATVIIIPWLWLTLFFLIPFLIVLKISFAETRLAVPPYTPLWEWVDNQYLQLRLNAGNYLFLLKDSLYAQAFASSLKVAFFSTIFCLLIGYPMSYAIARADSSWRNTLLMLIILPFWTSFLLRVYAWIGLLSNHGVINNILMGLRITKEPIVMMQTDFAMYIGIVYSYLPFMILPLYSNLEKHDQSLIEAAVDLGCKPFRAFLLITLPLSIPGIVAGSMLVFIPAVGEFVIPRLLGGTNSLMIGRVLWDEFFLNRDWPVAGAVAIALLLVLVAPIMIFQRYQLKEGDADAAAAVGGARR
jgi:putrescine transport system permease protein